MSPEAGAPHDEARILRPAGEGDIDWVMAEERRPDFAEFVSVWPYERHAGFLDDPDKRLLIAEDGRGARTGFVNAQGLTTAAHAVELPRIIVSKPGRGLGRWLIAGTVRLAFSEWGANRLWLDVYDDNARAIAAYERAGFVREGCCAKPWRKAPARSARWSSCRS